MSDEKMAYEDWLRGCVYHDGRHGYVTLPCDEVLKIADFIESLRTDRKTENNSEKPNNCEPQTCENCYYYSDVGVKCCDREHEPTTPTTKACEFYEPKDEPQTDCPWK